VANDFGGQEPGSNAEVPDYCRAVWGVDSPVFEKISVGNRKNKLRFPHDRYEVF
jgi:glutathione peroxidase